MAELPSSLMADPEIRPTVKVVLATLYAMTHWEDRSKPFAWPSTAELMRRTGLKRTAVVSAIRESKSLGVVKSDTRTTRSGEHKGYALAPHDENGAAIRFARPCRETGTIMPRDGHGVPRDGHGVPRDGHDDQEDRAARRARPCRETGTDHAARRARHRTHQENQPENPPLFGRSGDRPEIEKAQSTQQISMIEATASRSSGGLSTRAQISGPPEPRAEAEGTVDASVDPKTIEAPQRETESSGVLSLFSEPAAPDSSPKTRRTKARLSEDDAVQLLAEQNDARNAIALRLRKSVRGIGMRPGIRKAMGDRIREGYTLEQLSESARIRKRISGTERDFHFAGTESFWARKAVEYALGQADRTQVDRGRPSERPGPAAADDGLKVIAQHKSGDELFG